MAPTVSYALPWLKVGESIWEGLGGVSFGVGFDVSNAHTRPSWLFLSLYLMIVVSRCKLSATAPVPCLLCSPP